MARRVSPRTSSPNFQWSFIIKDASHRGARALAQRAVPGEALRGSVRPEEVDVFVGHYGPSFAIKAVRPEIPLWLHFVAVRLRLRLVRARARSIVETQRDPGTKGTTLPVGKGLTAAVALKREREGP